MNTDDAKDLSENLKKLTNSIKHLYHLQEISTKKSYYLSRFMGGMFMGLGFAFGTSILLTLVLWGLSKLEIVPILGGFVSDIVSIVEEKQPSKN